MNPEYLTSGKPVEYSSVWMLALTWVLLLPLLVFASQTGFSFERGTGNTAVGAAEAGLSATSSKEESNVVRYQVVAVYMLCCALMLPLARQIIAEFRRDLLLTMLVTVAFASMAWTQNPKETILTSVYLALDIGFSIYLLQRLSANDLMKVLMLVGSAAAAASIALIVLFPQFGLQSRGDYALGTWQGIFTHKNICGEVFSYLLLPVFFVKMNGRFTVLIRYVYALVLLVIIGMTHSAGSWVICGATILSIILFRVLAKRDRKDAAIIILVGFSCVSIVGVLVYQYMDVFLSFLGKDPTLTGRTTIWGLLFVSIMKRPLTGYGYMAFWQGMKGESANVAIPLNWPGIAYAENGLLELWLELGLIGVLLFVFAFFRAVRDGIYCFRRHATSEVMWYMSILAFTVFSNIEAGKVLSPSNLECILQIVAFIGLRKERQLLQSQGAV